MTINPEVRIYRPNQVPPKQLFEEAAAHLTAIQNALSSSDQNGSAIQTFTEMVEEQMIALIFSSNANERAGLDHAETRRICNRVFAGEQVSATKTVTQHQSEQYQRDLEYLRIANGIQEHGSDDVIKARREVIQHAQALQHIVGAFLSQKDDTTLLTEKLIKETHKILYEGIQLDSRAFGDLARTVGTSYAGVYRQHHVYAGCTQFTDPQEAPWRMAKLVKEFNEDVRSRQQSGKMDPFYLSADVAQDFVTIHPFSDGNGRMSRLLLSADLFKFAGVIADIGEHQSEREEYMWIARESTGGGTFEEERARAKFGGIRGRESEPVAAKDGGQVESTFVKCSSNSQVCFEVGRGDRRQASGGCSVAMIPL